MEDAIDAFVVTRDAVADVKNVSMTSKEYTDQSDALKSLLSEVGACATRLGVSPAFFIRLFMTSDRLDSFKANGRHSRLDMRQGSRWTKITRTVHWLGSLALTITYESKMPSAFLLILYLRDRVFLRTCVMIYLETLTLSLFTRVVYPEWHSL